MARIRWINPTSLSTCQGKAGDQRIQGLMVLLECDLKPLCIFTRTLSRGLASLLLPSLWFMTSLKLKYNSVLWNKNPKEIQFLSHMLVSPFNRKCMIGKNFIFLLSWKDLNIISPYLLLWLLENLVQVIPSSLTLFSRGSEENLIKTLQIDY